MKHVSHIPPNRPEEYDYGTIVEDRGSGPVTVAWNINTAVGPLGRRELEEGTAFQVHDDLTEAATRVAEALNLHSHGERASLTHCMGMGAFWRIRLMEGGREAVRFQVATLMEARNLHFDWLAGRLHGDPLNITDLIHTEQILSALLQETPRGPDKQGIARARYHVRRRLERHPLAHKEEEGRVRCECGGADPCKEDRHYCHHPEA